MQICQQKLGIALNYYKAWAFVNLPTTTVCKMNPQKKKSNWKHMTFEKLI